MQKVQHKSLTCNVMYIRNDYMVAAPLFSRTCVKKDFNKINF